MSVTRVHAGRVVAAPPLALRHSDAVDAALDDRRPGCMPALGRLRHGRGAGVEEHRQPGARRSPRSPTARARSSGVPDGDDTVAMLACLGGLGVTTERLDDGSSAVRVAGRGGAFESGATLARRARRHDLAVRHGAGGARARAGDDRRRPAAARPADGGAAWCAAFARCPRRVPASARAISRSP